MNTKRSISRHASRPWAFALGLAACLSAPIVGAQTLDRPAGLNPGDQYRLVFVTDGRGSATSADISTYNQFVSAEAAASNSLVRDLNTTWSILGSTPDVDALENTGTDPRPAGDTGVPIYLVDGTTRVADNYDLFWGFGTGILASAFGGTPPDAHIAITQSGAQLGSNELVWTGTTASSIATVAINESRLGTSTPAAGRANDDIVNWTSVGNDPGLVGPPSTQHRYYAISGVLTVAVPEPTAALLLAPTLLGVVGLRRRR